jgi:hypothetical protein
MDSALTAYTNVTVMCFFAVQAAYSFCPHHVSHYLGMDVHDTALIPRSVPLEPGMVITVEPGKLFMYIIPFDSDDKFFRHGKRQHLSC